MPPHRSASAARKAATPQAQVLSTDPVRSREARSNKTSHLELPLRRGMIEIGIPGAACVDRGPAVREILKLAIRTADPERLAELEAEVLARKGALGLTPACTCARPGGDPEVCARDHLLTRGVSSLGAAIAARKVPCLCPCHPRAWGGVA